MQLTTILTLASAALAAPAPALEARDTLTDTTWYIRNFTLNCTDPNICTYKFVIDTVVETQPCSVVNLGSPATSQSWYDVGCAEKADYRISWGWNYVQNFTVMTVQHNASQKRAFFGYSNPLKGLPVASFADVKSQVYVVS